MLFKLKLKLKRRRKRIFINVILSLILLFIFPKQLKEKNKLNYVLHYLIIVLLNIFADA